MVIIRQAPPSRNMPIMSRTRLHSIRNTNLLLVRFSMAVATILGMLTQLRYWPNTLAETMIRTTLEVPAMVSIRMGMKCFLRFNFR